MSELRSNYEEAEKESSLMENKGSEIQEHFTIPIYQTNLPVVANMQNAMNCLGATNQRYQVLISGNADAIRKLGLERVNKNRIIKNGADRIDKVAARFRLRGAG